jgi:hypothetical protein
MAWSTRIMVRLAYSLWSVKLFKMVIVIKTLQGEPELFFWPFTSPFAASNTCLSLLSHIPSTKRYAKDRLEYEVVNP